MLQTIINLIYRYPKSKLALYIKFGGYFDYRKMIKSRKLMEQTAYKLKPVKSEPNGLSVYFLTGTKYLYQTLFCIQSLHKCAAAKFRYVLIDDGTFNDQLIAQIAKLLPGAEIITKEIIAQNLNKLLPADKFPILHQKRKEYPHIKKLTDIHTLPGKWKLVLDSDMLFWNEPKEMINWLQNPNRPIHMVDCVESYGYSDQLMTELANKPNPRLVNVGAIGLNSESIAWKEIEQWIHVLEATEGKSYYLEQALTAMIIGDTDCEVLNKKKYIVNPSNDMILNKNGSLHHYVDLSKKNYFGLAWRNLTDQ